MRSVPTDVPVHRPSVGAMAVTQGSQMPAKITRPYVYRGTGEDQFPETVERPKPEPKPAITVEEYREREVTQARAREVAAMKRRAKRRREERWAAEAAERRKRIEAERLASLPPLPLPEVGEEDPEPLRLVHPARYNPKPRPARGWKPMTVGDIDALLEEIGSE